MGAGRRCHRRDVLRAAHGARRAPVRPRVLEAITAILAVVVLFYVSFWLIARLEQKRWMEFLRARVWTRGVRRLDRRAGPRRVHRRLPRGLRDRALLPGAAVVRRRPRRLGRARARRSASSRSPSCRGVIFRLGRRLPVRAFLRPPWSCSWSPRSRSSATPCASLQEADVIAPTPLAELAARADLPGAGPRLLAEPRDVIAQARSRSVYVLGAVYMFVIRPRRAVGAGARRRSTPASIRRPSTPGRRDAVRSRRRRRRRDVHEGRRLRPRRGRGRRPRPCVADDARPRRRRRRRRGATSSPSVAATSAPTRVELVTHSTTQAVNALLEGDVGHRRDDRHGPARRTSQGPQAHDLNRDRARAGPDPARPCRSSSTSPTGSIRRPRARAVERLRGQGAEAIAVAEAFAPDDVDQRGVGRRACATELGLPATTSAELTGLYGLELRAVTAALNASILPIAIRTAEVVGDGRRRGRHRAARSW